MDRRKLARNMGERGEPLSARIQRQERSSTGFDSSAVPKGLAQSSDPVRDHVTRAGQVDQRGLRVRRGGSNAVPITLSRRDSTGAADRSQGRAWASQWTHAPDQTRSVPGLGSRRGANLSERIPLQEILPDVPDGFLRHRFTQGPPDFSDSTEDRFRSIPDRLNQVRNCSSSQLFHQPAGDWKRANVRCLARSERLWPHVLPAV